MTEAYASRSGVRPSYPRGLFVVGEGYFYCSVTAGAFVSRSLTWYKLSQPMSRPAGIMRVCCIYHRC